MEQQLTKLGEIKFRSIDTAHLLKLDPAIPYLVVVDYKATTEDIQKLTEHLSRSNVFATIIVGDPSKFRVFASFPWVVQPAVSTPTAKTTKPRKTAAKAKKPVTKKALTKRSHKLLEAPADVD